jgi:fused signal recognition particle receptor
MFGFLKNKLKDAVSKFSKKVDEEVEDKVEEIEEVKEQPKVEKKVEKKEVKKEKKKENPQEEKEDKPKEKKKEVKSEVKKEPAPKEKKPEEPKEEEKKKEEPKAEEKPAEELKPEEKDEVKALEEEKEIIKEETKLEESPKVEQAPVEKEVEEIVKEEKEKELEEKRIEKEEELESVEKKGKKSFFGGLFKKKKEEETEQELEEAESKEEEKEEIKEEKHQVEEKEPEPEVKKELAPKEKEPEEKKEEVKEEPEEEKKGFFKKISKKVTTKKISESQFEDFFWDLELALLENNVAVEVIEKIKDDLKQNLVDKALPRSKILETINNTLQSSIKEILEVQPLNFLKKIEEKKPYVICFIGINGSGKTTSIAKVANLLKKNNKTCVLAAADTFRAAAIDQLQYHADKLDVKIIKQDYGSDPAAVAFDAIKHAEAKGIDVVLIDTAGRMHSNANLQDEMKKIIRVAKPDLKIFVGESITGNDCTEQAKQFNDSVSIDGIILSKQDIDEKGGAALSVSYITKKPILFIGTGQEYDDLKEFDSKIILDNLGL